MLLFIQQIIAQQDAWIYLTDKSNVSEALADPITILTQKALDRKALHGVVIDERDVPVDVSYSTQIEAATGITVMAKSKWFNALHVRGTETDINALTSFGFVDTIDFADKSLNARATNSQQEQDKFEVENTLVTFIYGSATNQIEMFNGDELHLLDYSGSGMTIAVLDAGFPNVNTMSGFQRLRDAGNLLDGYDFVDRTSDVYASTASSHGTMVLSDMAGYVADNFVGTAPDATYYLFRTEDALNENPVEESYWVEAAERADSLGVNIINTSLGYTTFDNSSYDYTNADMDGNTAFITKGANIAFEKGMLLVNSAGNSGNNSWGIVGAPADAPGVLSVGAVDASGVYASFSSVGNATQPTQKPDVVAQGLASYVIDENGSILTKNGTSFSSPILAGGIACLWQALPNKTNAEIMQLVRESASQYGSPDYLLGYGIPDLQLALSLSLGTYEEISITVFPNPTDGNLTISSATNDMIRVELFDLVGKQVYQNNDVSINGQVDISFLSDGIYIAQINVGSYSKRVKIIKHYF